MVSVVLLRNSVPISLPIASAGKNEKSVHLAYSSEYYRADSGRMGSAPTCFYDLGSS